MILDSEALDCYKKTYLSWKEFNKEMVLASGALDYLKKISILEGVRKGNDLRFRDFRLF